MSWAGLETETWGMQQAWANLQGDAAGMAAYAYDRMSAYVGPNHPAICANLIQRLIGIVAGESTPGDGNFRRDETPPPDDVNEVLAWEGHANGWTTAYRGGKNRDGVPHPRMARDPEWWAWSSGITASFTWWRPAIPPSETREDAALRRMEDLGITEEGSDRGAP